MNHPRKKNLEILKSEIIDAQENEGDCLVPCGLLSIGLKHTYIYIYMYMGEFKITKYEKDVTKIYVC